MTDNNLQLTDDYKNWLTELKNRIKHAQQKAMLAVNKELVLLYMRAFAKAWSKNEIVQEVLGQLPWYHHLTLLDKRSDKEGRMAYARL